MSAREFFDDLVASHKTAAGGPEGSGGRAGRAIGSVCSAHPIVLEAAFLQGLRDGGPVLIESTANQVNQLGGYTGTTPEGFRQALVGMAHALGFAADRLIVGGDHLGPFPWRREPASSAMAKARALVQACVRAGYEKLHLDASMPLGGDAAAGGGGLDPRTVAEREANLAAAAEEAAAESRAAPVYVIGTEVPVPGGTTAADAGVTVTTAHDLAATFHECRSAFHDRGLDGAWGRVRALVAQPGVEFGDQAVHPYDRVAAHDLCSAARQLPGVVLEGHSTDYQDERHLRQLVEDGVAILKVGPWLTFVLRECLFNLERIEQELFGSRRDVALSNLAATVEEAMTADPAHWQPYYHGSAEEQRLARRYSLSDRIRYYWTVPSVRAASERLLGNLSGADIPRTLLSQFLPVHVPAVLEGSVMPRARDLARESVRSVLEIYARAARPAREGRAPRGLEGLRRDPVLP